MKNIFVITHTESVHHVERKVGGWYDTGLTERGVAQAKIVANKLLTLIKGKKPIITSSDLLRTQQTASIVADAFGCEFKTNSDLREKSYGIAEGKPQNWLSERLVLAPDDNRLHHRIIDGGESIAEFINRIYRAVDELIASTDENHIVITHGFAPTFIIARWIKMPSEAAGFVNFRSSAGGITHLREDDHWRNRGVVQLNDLSHFS